MATLNHWRKYLRTPKTLSFESMNLTDRGGKVIGSGRGEIRLASANDFRFTMTSVPPTDPQYTLKAIFELRRAPQDPTGHPRVLCTDRDGLTWSCHYVAPWIYPKHGLWAIGGQIVSLLTRDERTTVSSQASTELLLSLPIGTQLSLAMAYVIASNSTNSKRPECVLEVLGSEVRFRLEGRNNRLIRLMITAPHSAELPAHYSEAWLVQPLRMMFGELIRPRLIARNDGKGGAYVWVTRSPEFVSDANWAPLWERDYYNRGADLFWRRYSQLLQLIARGRRPDGTPLEQHEIPRLYEEIVEAGRGSHWVWAMTFASAIEAIARMLIPQKSELSEAEAEANRAFIEHINKGPNNERLRQIAVNAIRRTEITSTNQALRQLRTEGIITKEQLAAREKLRNSAMHGNLLSPYTSNEEYEKLQALTAMLHALTRAAVGKLAPDYGMHDPADEAGSSL